MAFGNYAYGGYQPFCPQAIPDQLTQYRQNPIGQLPMMQPMQQQDSRIFVQGEQSAKAYLVANGNTVVLWDSESPTIYLKSVDASGMPSMRVLDITERNTPSVRAPETVQANKINAGDFITRDEFNSLSEQVRGLIDRNMTVEKAES